MSNASRQYELVLLGATGYTGKLTAEHITTSLPTDLKWAIAGRNEKKLANVAEGLKKLNSDRPQPDIKVLELKGEELDNLVQSTRLVISTVGPFMKYGTPVVEACAKHGTHYLDCTGEVPWVLEMINKYHDVAKANGAIMIPQSGVDSVPADLIAYVAATHIRQTLGLGTAEVLDAAELNAKPSGGTLLTGLSLFDHYSLAQIGKALSPFALSPVQPQSRTSPGGLVSKILGVRQDKDLGYLTDWVGAKVDGAIVERSWGLLDGGKLYGPKFSFSEHMPTKSALSGALVHFGMVFSMMFLAIPPVRWIAKKLIYQPGDGPEMESTKNDYLYHKAIATADSSKGERAVVEFRFNGSMYYFTGLALAEAAMVILRGGETEAKKLGGGILTPATLGGEYVERLRKANTEIRVQLQ
ncbi:saccharopine dehydrogenase [Diplodia corticola]|uniref:Saccharopine dehydrogenase n=1 Tax=Diplodia corticola TaxID=236234 RepID=A0A1J9R2G2_9PEZI|nr:saccharopine dehydrogenase [Diplodia corticola]OJD34816.1 saccharopine dehydrogenase [Diplodia corticola]